MSESPKRRALRDNNTLNPQPEGVRDPLFQETPFFDADDLVQVKYEMLRRVREDGLSVAQASSDFGFSRVAFYDAQRAWQREGVGGLLPRPRGPKHGHKLTDEVMDFVRGIQRDHTHVSASELVAHVRERFGVSVHIRSMERALAREAKKGLSP